MDEKVGQSSIWIILGVVLAASIIFFFIFLRNPDIEDKDYAEFNPETFLEECMQDVSQKIMPFVESGSNEEEVLGAIEFAVALRVDECFDRMEDEYKGGILEAGECKDGVCVINSKLLPFGELRKIYFKIENKVRIDELGKTRTYDQFEVEIVVKLPT
jgi:hypothetical protein